MSNFVRNQKATRMYFFYSNLRAFSILFLCVYSTSVRSGNNEPLNQTPTIKINCGGERVSFEGKNYLSDRYASSGNAYANTSITGIGNTGNDEIYKTERSATHDLADVNYEIPVANGSYTVVLHFAEIYWGAPGGGSGGIGKRIFDITLEGGMVLDNFDIYEEVGALQATSKQFLTDVGDGVLNIDLVAEVNRPTIAAIEIYGGQMRDTHRWEDVSRSDIAKTEGQTATVNGKLYVFSGFVNDLNVTDKTEIYDYQTNTWSYGTSMPFPGTHMGKVTVGDEVWFLGGFLGADPGTATDKVQIYNTVTDTWTSGAPLPFARASGAAVYQDNKIYYFGGLKADRETGIGDLIVLDLTNQTAGWTSLSPMPDPRNHLGGIALNGKIYAIGGQTGHDGPVVDKKLVHRYDPLTDTWARISDLPTPRSHFEPGIINYDNKIFIVGGKRSKNVFENDIITYDPAVNTWDYYGTLPFHLMAPGAAILNDELIVVNGSMNNNVYAITNKSWKISLSGSTLSTPVFTAQTENLTTVYPVPTQTTLNITLGAGQKAFSNHVQIRVFSINGQRINTDNTVQGNTISVNLPSLPGGIYMYEVRSDEITSHGKFLIN